MVTHIDAGTRADDEGDRPFFLFFLLARWSDFGSKTPPPPPPQTDEELPDKTPGVGDCAGGGGGGGGSAPKKRRKGQKQRVCAAFLKKGACDTGEGCPFRHGNRDEGRNR